MKKIFGMLVCMLLALGLVPNLAFATGENEAKIGDTEYATLQEALEHVQAGETVTLLKDVTTNKVTQNLTTDMTLDLGGFTLTNIGGIVFHLYADLTLQNGKVAMTEANNTVAIWMHEAANLHIATDAQVTADNSVAGASWAVGMWSDCDGAVLTVDGILGGEAGFTVNGSIKQADLESENGNRVYINDSALIDTKYYGLYLAGFADTMIGEATIAGETGIEIRAGNLTIDGAYVRATGDFDAAANPGGTTTTGVALAVSQHTTNQTIHVIVKDGLFEGDRSLYEADLQDGLNIEDVTLEVLGGTFAGEFASTNHTAFVAAGAFEQAINSKYVVAGKTIVDYYYAEAGEDSGYYLVGDSTDLASQLAGLVSGNVITVHQGDLALENMPGNITVKNLGDGAVSVNHIVVPTGESVTTVEATDSEGVSPQTGEAINIVALLSVLGIASLAFSGAYLSSRRQA